jgi:polyhydroxyalkanoate synthesis regulator phasin
MASTAHLIDQLVSDGILNPDDSVEIMPNIVPSEMNKGNNKITELRTILQRESQNS